MPNPRLGFGVNCRFANTDFTCFEKLKSGAVSKRLSLKPLGTDSAVENGLATPKNLLRRQYYKADSQPVIRFLKQKIQPQKKPENDFHEPARFKIEVRNATKNTLTLTLNILFKLRFPRW
ncbi:TPA: hypothetical protein ACVU40_004633, partial [Vibrio parahaemolyticus]